MSEESAALLDVPPPLDEWLLVARLRNGDEEAFTAAVRLYHPSMVRFAMGLLGNRAVAEEAVQETWLAVLRSIDRFEGRSSLRTWMFTILANFVRKRGAQEARAVPFAGLGEADEGPEALADDPRFFGAGHRWAGAWTTSVDSWEGIPEERLLGRESLAVFAAAVERLPAAQAQVLRLRDVEGWTAAEVCGFLGLTEVNQRVLLHRARTKVRAALDAYFAGE